MIRKDRLISTQTSDKDSLPMDGESKYQAFKPNLRLRVNGVNAFLWGKWLKAAFLAVFLFILSFNVVFASVGTIFSADRLDWVKSQISGIFSENDNEDQEKTISSQNLIVSQDSYIVKTSSPEADAASVEQKQELIIDYKVKEGDTLIKIATDFGISLNTLLWANNLNQKSIIQIGQELKVLPIDGVLYTVKKGDTLASISKKYKADQEQIVDFNGLASESILKEELEIIIPGGVMIIVPEASTQAKKQSSAVQSVKKSATAAKQAAKLAWEAAEKFFIIPVSGIITQGKHNYTPPAIDIGNSCGTSIFAAADGIVTVVRETNSRSRSAEGGYGNNIRIQHSDGSLSLYSHLLAGSILVNEGDFVKQGQKIAEIGGGWIKKGVRMAGAGRSSGCHLHFEVRNGINPFTSYPYRKGMVVKTPAANLAIDDSASGAGDSGDEDNQGTGFSGTISEPYKPNANVISNPYKSTNN